MDEYLATISSVDITVGSLDSGMSFGDPISIGLSGPEHEVLREIGDQVVEEISTIEGIYNPESSATTGVPQMSIVIDKEKAATYGLDQEQVTGQIDTQFTGQLATPDTTAGQEMDVTLLYPENERSEEHT